MNYKTKLREQAKNIRKTLNLSEISSEIVSNIRKSEIYKNATKIMIFYPLKNEINLLPLAEDNKEFFLPRVKENIIECCPWNKNDKLKISSLNIKEPITNSVDKNTIDIIFVPALFADKNFYRLGYGGGYYDRLLTDYKGLSMIVIPEELLTECLPIEDYDIKCSGIFTQKKCLFTLRG